ncbi:MAG: phosphatidylglycerophosphatase A [Candidatus Omnitrophota bacterium]
MVNRLAKLIATFLGVGYLPFFPGTFGSAAALILFLIVKPGFIAQCVFLAVFTVLGFSFSGKAEKLFNSKDPKYIVIDEVAGMFLTLLFVPWDFNLLLIGFLLFRVLDTAKPFPAGRLQNLPGSAGIMLDDISAGIYANLILQFLSRVLLKIPA